MFAKIAFQESKDGALISATNDEEAIEIFYAEKKVSTRNAFEREIRRFCYWMEAQGLTLKALTHAHVKAYKTLLSSPPSEACGPPVKYYLDAGKAKINPDWRPFKGPLSSNSVKAAINLLGSFGRWLADAGYLNANPFSLMNRGVESASTIKNQMISKTVDVEHHFTPVEMLWMNTALTSLKDEAETKKRKSLRRGIIGYVTINQ
jgi:site-specific recombinase XerD